MTTTLIAPLTAPTTQWLCQVIRGETPQSPDATNLNLWADIWQAGLEHGVLPLCHYYLKKTPAWSTLPIQLQEQFSTTAIQAAAAELALKFELEAAFSAFNSQGIKFILMKGTPLAYSHYPEPYLRTRCDTDIFFENKQDAEKAWGIISDMGYSRPNEINTKYISHQFSCYKESLHDYSLHLDMHWAINNGMVFLPLLPFKECYESRIPAPGLGDDIYSLGPEHALVLACIHRVFNRADGAQDKLIWLYDIHLLASRFTDKQWHHFVQLILDKRLAAIYIDGYEKSRVTFNTQIPKWVTEAISQKAKENTIPIDIRNSHFSYQLASFNTLNGWKEKFSFIKEIFIPDQKYMVNKYNPSNRHILPLLYANRAIQGIARRILK